jgi:hypothetical protein
MPLITTLAGASAKGYGGLLTFGGNTAFESIATVTVGSGGSTSVSFTSIPSTYAHLQIRSSFTTSTAGQVISARLNSDTGSNYLLHSLIGNGTAASVNVATSQPYATIFGRLVGTFTTNPSVVVTEILDYTNTNKNTTVRSLGGADNNGSGELNFISNLWINTAAITSIEISPFNGAVKFNEYSHFALYGIKGA